MIGSCASCTEWRELVPDVIDGKRVAICRWCRDGEIGRPQFHAGGGGERTVIGTRGANRRLYWPGGFS